MSYQYRLSFEQLADSATFARFSDIIRALTGMPLALYPPDGSYGVSRDPVLEENPLCILLHGTPMGVAACRACDLRHLALARTSEQACCYRCHAGMIDIAIPIMHHGAVLAIISSGQLLPEPHSEEGMRAFVDLCGRYGVPPEAVCAAYQRAPYLPPDKVDATISLMTFFAEFFCDMHQRLLDATRGGPDVVVAQACAIIDRRVEEELSLESVAALVDRSPSYLSRRFRRALGVSFTAYLQQARITRAKTLLRQTVQPIAEVAFASGFNSLSQFNRTFSRQEGCTPRDYRRAQLSREDMLAEESSPVELL